MLDIQLRASWGWMEVVRWVSRIEPDVIRKKGENTICPRDQRIGG
jgi:hypothetical protein